MAGAADVPRGFRRRARRDIGAVSLAADGGRNAVDVGPLVLAGGKGTGGGEIPAALTICGHAGSAYCAGLVSFSMTWLRLKEPGFARGGKSLKLWIHWAVYPMAGPIRNA